MSRIKRYTYIRCEECRHRRRPTCRKPHKIWSSTVVLGCIVRERDAAQYRNPPASGCPACGSRTDGNSLCRHCAELYGIVRDAAAGRDPARAVLDRRRKEEESAL